MVRADSGTLCQTLTWVRVVASVLLALSLMNGFYIESQMSDKRDELTEVFDQ